MPERWREAVRVHDYKIHEAANWAIEHRSGILWYMNREVGIWLAETLAALHLNPLHCPSGAPHDRAIVDPGNANRLIVASWKAHGEGKNLQHHENNLVIQWPRGQKEAEQMIGRTHRVGQQADELVIHRLEDQGHRFDQELFSACLNDACYTQGTLGTAHKLLYAVHDPLPKVFPNSYLRERGFQPYTLTRQQEVLLGDKFNS